jgi:NADPH-dependent curcumin reductase CurA
VIGKRLRLQGFIVSDHFDLAPQFVAELSGWIESGQFHYRETVDEGIAAAPAAFLKLFTGENFGKMLVKLA